MKLYERRITAAPEDLDELGHVNNAVWVRWIQGIATAHWQLTARAQDRDAYFWVVVRHEIDYLRAVFEGETVTARTWIPDPPRGAKFDRHIEFVGEDGKPRVRSVTTWAMIDKASGRPQRVTPEIATPFLS